MITLPLFLDNISFTRTNHSSMTKRPRNGDGRFETTFQIVHKGRPFLLEYEGWGSVATDIH